MAAVVIRNGEWDVASQFAYYKSRLSWGIIRHTFSTRHERNCMKKHCWCDRKNRVVKKTPTPWGYSRKNATAVPFVVFCFCSYSCRSTLRLMKHRSALKPSKVDWNALGIDWSHTHKKIFWFFQEPSFKVFEKPPWHLCWAAWTTRRDAWVRHKRRRKRLKSARLLG